MPNQSSHDKMAVNPEKLIFESESKDARSGKEKFKGANLYIAFEPVLDSNLKVNVQFKQKPKK